jgi:HEAT repeat protein
VVQALKRLGDRSATGALVEALMRGSASVQWCAAQALRALGWQPGTPTEELHLCVATGELQQAAMFGPEAVAPLAKVLKEGSYQQRVMAANVLGGMTSLTVLKPLLSALKDADALVRTAAAAALALQQSHEAVGGLTAALKDRERNVRAAAAAALGRLGNELAGEPLVAALNDADWQVRSAALEALARLGQRSALAAVLGRLSDPDPEVREVAADTVAALGDERTIEPLLPNLVDVHAGVRQAALRALNRISTKWERSPCVQSMVVRLQAAAKHDDSGVQYAAVTLLKRITGLSAAELSQASERARAEARGQLIAGALAALLNDRDAVVRLAAAEAIGRERSPACADALRQALDDPDHWVQVAVREALTTFNPSSPGVRA